MKADSLVSVIIPVYNGERFLAEALESVLAQSYCPLEVVLVDDGSTDSTSQIVAGYRERVRYIYRPHAGVSAARNHGLMLARGEYVVFFDGDDLMLPGKLAQQAALFAADPSLGLVHSGWHRVDRCGRLLYSVRPWEYAPWLDLETWVTRSPVCLGALMFRRQPLEAAGGFDPALPQCEDVDLLLRLALAGCPGAWLRRITFCYRKHPRGVTQQVVEAVECLNRVRADFFARPDIPERIRQLENDVRYNSLMWGVYRLFRAGYLNEMTGYLRESLAFSGTSPARTILRWLGSLIISSDRSGQGEIEHLRVLFPVFKAAIEVDESLWTPIERLGDKLLTAEALKRSRASRGEGAHSSPPPEAGGPTSPTVTQVD